MVVEDHGSGGVGGGQVGVGDPLRLGRHPHSSPVAADHAQRDARLQRSSYHWPHPAARVGDEERRVARRPGLAKARVETSGVGALQQRDDPVLARPGQRGGERDVICGKLIGGDVVGVADHPDQVRGVRGGRDPLEATDREHHVGAGPGGTVAGLGVVDLDPLAEPLEGVGQRAGEVPVAPAAANWRSARGDVERPVQALHPLHHGYPGSGFTQRCPLRTGALPHRPDQPGRRGQHRGARGPQAPRDHAGELLRHRVPVEPLGRGRGQPDQHGPGDGEVVLEQQRLRGAHARAIEGGQERRQPGPAWRLDAGGEVDRDVCHRVRAEADARQRRDHGPHDALSGSGSGQHQHRHLR